MLSGVGSHLIGNKNHTTNKSQFQYISLKFQLVSNTTNCRHFRDRDTRKAVTTMTLWLHQGNHSVPEEHKQKSKGCKSSKKESSVLNIISFCICYVILNLPLFYRWTNILRRTRDFRTEIVVLSNFLLPQMWLVCFQSTFASAISQCTIQSRNSINI